MSECSPRPLSVARPTPLVVLLLAVGVSACAPSSELERPDAAWRLNAEEPVAEPATASHLPVVAAPPSPAASTRPPAQAQTDAGARRPLAPAAGPAPAPVPVPAPPTAASEPPRLRISEVMTDPLLVDDRAGEYVELVHLGDGPVSIDALAIKAPSGKTIALEREADPTLRPGDVLLVTPLGLDEREAMARGLRLPNRAARIELLWHDQVIDVAQWTGKWPWPKHRVGASIERVSGDADGTQGRSWRRARAPLRRVERGSPGVCPWRLPPTAAAEAETTATGRPPIGEDPVASVAGEGLEPST